MIIVLRPDATEEQQDHIIKKLKGLGLQVHISKGTERTILGAIGDEAILQSVPLEAIPGVEKVHPILKPYKLASRDFRTENTVIDVGGMQIGGNRIAVMAGPCAVENKTLLVEIAKEVKQAGATFLRGGAFKPRTSPYAFQGLEEEGLKYLAETRERVGLPVVTEVMDPRDIDMIVKYADVLQIGARNMQNFTLLRAASRSGKPILLKRGAGATIEEWLMAAEYILAEGNPNVVLCERGIRTFERATRHTLDLNAVVMVRERTHLPVIVDPSHAAGVRSLVVPLGLGSLAAGACGLLVEVHPDPDRAMSDGAQSLDLPMFADLASRVHPGRQADVAVRTA